MTQSFGRCRILREQPPAQLPVDRPAVVRVDERERLELVALVDVRARRGTVSFSSDMRERDPLAVGAQPLGERARGRGASQRAQRPCTRRSARLVRRRASSSCASPRGAPSRGTRRAARCSIGQAPTSVCSTRYALVRVVEVELAAARTRRPLVGEPVSATSRARTSGERFVSCVYVVSRCRGKRAARSMFAAWNSSTGSVRTARGRRRPRSARRAGCSGRTPCPRRPSPSPAPVVCWKRRHELVVAALLEQEDARERRRRAPARAIS